jgi:hypothetical protein
MNLLQRIGVRAPKALAAGLLLLTVGGTAATAVSKHAPRADENWTTYKNERFGYTLYYPAAIFDTAEAREGGAGQNFVTRDGRTKIVVFGTLNSENFSPQEYRRVILNEFGGYDKMDYSPSGQSWFVLSGFRGDNIYYQKVMFSCGNKVINVFSMTFPTAEKSLYEAYIETMEDHFKAGRGQDTPQGC